MTESTPRTSRAVLVGEESLLIQCAHILEARGIEIAAVATSDAAIESWAAESGITALVNDDTLTTTLSSFSFDYLFSITNLRVLPPELCVQARSMAINFHDAPLPAYAGLYATSWALLGGETQHGVTWHTMEAAVDEGQILEQVRFDIAADETAYTLNVACYEHAIASFATLVDRLVAGTIEPTAQDLAGRSYFGRYRRPEVAATIDWSQTADDIARLVRALDFGNQPNPLAYPKVLLGDTVAFVHAVGTTTSNGETPGTVLAYADGTATIATSDGAVVVSSLTPIDGSSAPAQSHLSAAGYAPGDVLPALDERPAAELTDRLDGLARDEAFWQGELVAQTSPEVPYARPSEVSTDGPRSAHRIEVATPVADHLTATDEPAVAMVSAFACYLARLGGSQSYHVSFGSDELRAATGDLAPWLAPRVPLRCDLRETASVGDALDAVTASLARVRAAATHLVDLGVRTGTPGSAPATLTIGVDLAADAESIPSTGELDLVFVVDPDSGRSSFRYDAAVYSDDAIARLAGQFATFLDDLWSGDDLGRELHEIALLTAAEEHQIVVEWNDTGAAVATDSTLHEMVAARAALTPEAIAVTFEDTSISYAELDERANQLAHELRAAGADVGRCVGIHMTRGLDMVVALLGVLKSGAAYVPLDPTYPQDRVRFMAHDAQIAVLLTESRVVGTAPDHPGSTLLIDGDRDRIAANPSTAPDRSSGPDDLAYVIYTSGSTGRPKGVMVTHRNVLNFLGGMDAVLDHEPGDKWLTVTSLSFDISVLEIFWSLTHGLELVVYGEQPEGVATAAHASRAMDFSLFYFASDEGGADGADKYKLLLDGARFADEHGFAAVWTPERHFHEFGGLYPNPAVSGAALAAITENIQIRGGSCVIPLHHPARVAEEWSVVDNLSGGRVGIAFASGWQPVDFLLRPETFEDRKTVMMDAIETVRTLWRGDSVRFEGPTGPADIRTMPRPIQAELPAWLTVAGNPETFRMAGEAGYGVLTHLLGQTLEDVQERIEIYRAARRDAGHEGDGNVVLMLHTFVGDDVEQVKDLVREPMTQYLASSVSLIREAAWTFPTITQRSEETGKSPGEVFDDEDLSQEELDALLEHSFNRYFHGSALFGTVDSCSAMVDDLKRIGVDEIACQIDFGVPSSSVLDSLPLLDEVRRRSVPHDVPASVSPMANMTIPELITHHGITHFQCTPSMGNMLVADEAFRVAARRLDHCLMGGEAFPQALAEEITTIVEGSVINVYGPTETTIWSSVQPLTDSGGPVFIGRPLANQQMYIVDERLRPVPVGVPGELLIGGDGVTDGYLDRPELTAERFIVDHFRPDRSDARLYRTGDLARYNPDGSIDFLGRMDFQVKLRGYRIELGEIEARLTEHPSVREAVTVVREDTPGDQRLVGYVIAATGALDHDAVLAHVASHVPDFMVPTVLVEMDAFPLTPNKKTDRAALPAPEARQAVSQAVYAPAEDDTQRQIVELWQRLLGVTQVGIDDNFFDLGGHSLLAVNLHRELKETLEADISITDVFRFPTISSFTTHLRDRDGAAEEARAKVADRASARKAAMAGRRARRGR